jgi:NAD(P)-dependent dehydrogenase (short-subunit alcohol dehydrogenase family)
MTVLIGKTALVTGASRGIGRAIAERLAADGALVAVHYNSGDAAAKETVAAITAAGGRAFAVRAELGVDGDAETLVARLAGGLREHTGEAALDILVNNAALSGTGPIETDTPAAFDRLFAVNVRAPYFLIQRALPMLRAGGRVINIGSGAIDTLSRTLANTVGKRGITVNTVAPGTTKTERTAAMYDIPGFAEQMNAAQAIERTGIPADIAAVVAFLTSPDGGWVTGQWLDASGGCYLGPKLPA